VKFLDPYETLEKMTRLLEELNEISEEIPIIVEGRMDKKALRNLGIGGRIVVLNDGQSVLGTVEELSKSWKSAVILMDWDRKGGQLAHLLRDALESSDMKFNTDFRARMSYLAKKETKDVEGLPGFVERLNEATGRTE
jgi:5S rRNA maturation endonuclease (ribonuclease M5)